MGRLFRRQRSDDDFNDKNNSCGNPRGRVLFAENQPDGNDYLQQREYPIPPRIDPGIPKAAND